MVDNAESAGRQSGRPHAEGAGKGHDDGVAYAEVVLPSSAIDTSSWEYWTVVPKDVVHHYAAGPCPECCGRAEGHLAAATAPIEPVATTRAFRQRAQIPIEILVICNCGYGHGHPGATGCGRRWTMLPLRST